LGEASIVVMGDGVLGMRELSRSSSDGIFGDKSDRDV